MKKYLLICYLTALFSLVAKTSNAQTEVTFYTNMGDFVVEMYDTLQPITAGNFINLVNEKFYDGIIFHRVIDDFVIQGGDPTGTGSGGPGYTIPDEFDPNTSNVQGALGMANAGPNTGGSQFFVNLVDNTYLDPNYPVFGIVKSNFSVVDAIGNVPTNNNDRPLIPVIMDSVRVTLAGPLSVEEAIALRTTVSVFPNPASEEVTIDFGNNFAIENKYTLRIVNSLGQVILTKSIIQQKTKIDISSFNQKGVYYLQITDKLKNTIHKKLIKQ